MINKCKNCLYDRSHPFGLVIDENGVCSGCNTHKEKYSIDWNLKKERLRTIINKKIDKKKPYDCIVPIVGDAEDYFVIEKVLSLDLNPLVVHINNYFYNDIGWYNFQNLITHFDLDCQTFNPNMDKYKNAVRESLRKYNNIYWPYLNLLKTYPIKLALEKKINLIIWGQLQSIEQVGKFSHHDNIEMSKWSRIEHDLFNIDENKFFSTGTIMNEKDILNYKYPELFEINKSELTGLYLSNFFLWDPLNQNSRMVKYGFKPQKNNRSYDIYERAGSSVYYEFHDFTKIHNVGYSKIRDHLVREIRHNRVTKNEAIKIEKKYQNNYFNLNPFFNWLGLSKSGKEWYLKHISNNRKKRIINSIKLPTKISKLLRKSFSSKKEFCIYEKQI